MPFTTRFSSINTSAMRHFFSSRIKKLCAKAAMHNATALSIRRAGVGIGPRSSESHLSCVLSVRSYSIAFHGSTRVPVDMLPPALDKKIIKSPSKEYLIEYLGKFDFKIANRSKFKELEEMVRHFQWAETQIRIGPGLHIFLESLGDESLNTVTDGSLDIILHIDCRRFTVITKNGDKRGFTAFVLGRLAISNHLTSWNVVLGHDKNLYALRSDEELEMDPDWYFVPGENKDEEFLAHSELNNKIFNDALIVLLGKVKDLKKSSISPRALDGVASWSSDYEIAVQPWEKL